MTIKKKILRQPPVQSTDYRRLRESVGRECNYSTAHPHINFQNHRHRGIGGGGDDTLYKTYLYLYTTQNIKGQREKEEWRKMFFSSFHPELEGRIWTLFLWEKI
jgi:hypothetical protein